MFEKYIRHSTKKRKTFFLALLFFVPLKSFSFQERLNSFVVELEEEAKEFDNEALQRLHQFKREVEKTAYERTMRLCEGYRRVREQMPVKLPFSGVTEYHGKYMYSYNESMNQWLRILKEGALLPLSSIGGLKADYISGNQIGLFDYESWFGSVYTTYLLNSFGFLGASVHCLGTMNKRDIAYFAASIANVELAAQTVSEAGVGLTIGGAASIITKTLFRLRPAVYLMSVLKNRVTRPMILVGGASAVGLTVYGVNAFVNRLKEKFALSKMSQAALDLDSSVNEENGRTKRLSILYKTFEEILEYSPLEEEHCAENRESQACKDVYSEFEAFVKENYSQALFESMDKDLRDIRALEEVDELDESSKLYKELLEDFLPLVLEFYKSD